MALIDKAQKLIFMLLYVRRKPICKEEPIYQLCHSMQCHAHNSYAHKSVMPTKVSCHNSYAHNDHTQQSTKYGRNLVNKQVHLPGVVQVGFGSRVEYDAVYCRLNVVQIECGAG